MNTQEELQKAFEELQENTFLRHDSKKRQRADSAEI